MEQILRTVAQSAPVILVIPIWFFSEATKKFVRLINRENKVVDFIISYISPVIYGVIFKIGLEGIDTKVIFDGILVGGFAGWTYPIVKKQLKKIFKS